MTTATSLIRSMRMVPLYTPITASEEAVISSLLEAHEIPFFIRGSGFSKLYPGMQIDHYNTQTFMVPETEFELARTLIAEFISPTPSPEENKKSSLWEKVRVIFEILICGWLIPGKRYRNKE